MPRQLVLVTEDPAGTRAVAAIVAGALAPGDVVSLAGELGAGKTCFVQGAAVALGVRERVRSPTFLLRCDYDAAVPVTHLDVYRLEALAELDDVGLGGRERVTFIEWGDAAAALLPDARLDVTLELLDPHAPPAEAEARMLTLTGHGVDWAGRLDDLAGALAAWRR